MATTTKPKRPKFVYIDADGMAYDRPSKRKGAKWLSVSELSELRRRYEVILLRDD
jgi:hypothetical protein